MIEKVAAAMREELGVDWPYSGYAELIDVARAAIEAIREPDEAMNEAGYLQGEQRDHMAVWSAMIDAALKPQ